MERFLVSLGMGRETASAVPQSPDWSDRPSGWPLPDWNKLDKPCSREQRAETDRGSVRQRRTATLRRSGRPEDRGGGHCSSFLQTCLQGKGSGNPSETGQLLQKRSERIPRYSTRFPCCRQADFSGICKGSAKLSGRGSLPFWGSDHPEGPGRDVS